MRSPSPAVRSSLETTVSTGTPSARAASTKIS